MTLVTEVSDSGIGIAEADFTRIFQYFGRMQRKARLSPNTGGIGLGLSITKLIIQQL